MNCRTFLVLLVLLSVPLLATAQKYERHSRGDRSSRQSVDRNDNTSFSEENEIILERNIFLRDRRSRDRSQSNTPATPPQTPEQTWVLTGIVQDGAVYHAILENLSRGDVQKMSVGASLARGSLADIQIGQIAYDSPAGRTWINIGSNLTGSAVGSVSGERINAALSSGTPIDPNSPNLSIEDKMRLKRLQETKTPVQPPPGPGSAAPPNQTQAAPDNNQPPSGGEPPNGAYSANRSDGANQQPAAVEEPQAQPPQRPWVPTDGGLPDIGAPSGDAPAPPAPPQGNQD